MTTVAKPLIARKRPRPAPVAVYAFEPAGWARDVRWPTPERLARIAATR
jgi:hypothetical protein